MGITYSKKHKGELHGHKQRGSRKGPLRQFRRGTQLFLALPIGAAEFVFVCITAGFHELFFSPVICSSTGAVFLNTKGVQTATRANNLVLLVHPLPNSDIQAAALDHPARWCRCYRNTMGTSKIVLNASEGPHRITLSYYAIERSRVCSVSMLFADIAYVIAKYMSTVMTAQNR